MKKLWIMAVLAVFAGSVFGQLNIRKRTVTLDSLSSLGHDTIWLTNGNGGMAWLRISQLDSLYFGDASGEKSLGSIGGGYDANNPLTYPVYAANDTTYFAAIWDNGELVKAPLVDVSAGVDSIISTNGVAGGYNAAYAIMAQSGNGFNILIRAIDTTNFADINIDAVDEDNISHVVLSATNGERSSQLQVTITGFIFTQLSGSLTDGAPTAAQINSITGLTPSTATVGYQITINDSDGTGLLYKIESDGTDWYYTALTKAL